MEARTDRANLALLRRNNSNPGQLLGHVLAATVLACRGGPMLVFSDRELHGEGLVTVIAAILVGWHTSTSFVNDEILRIG